MGDKFPKHVNIIAKRDSSKPDGYKFHMESPNGSHLEVLSFNKTDEKMKEKDVHEVYFRLIQEQGMTLEFAHNLEDALWVAWGDEDTIPPCPTKRPDKKDEIFYADRSRPRTLVAVNTNPSRQFFSFCINFVDSTASGPKKLIPYDPPGDNQDGGIGMTDQRFVLVGAISGALGAAVSVALMPGNALEPPSVLLYGLGGAIVGLLPGLVATRF